MPRLSRLERKVTGRVALVTGAASGMGRATAYLFADEGAKVGVLDLDPARVAAVVTEIEKAGGTACGFAVDVADPARVRALPAEVEAKLGPLDILVNNAGVVRGGPIESEEYEEFWDFTLRVNLEAQVRLIRAFLPQLLRERAGRIINIASTEGLGATAGGSPYTVSKHGVVGLTRSLAEELRADGIAVNAVCPGSVDTPMLQVGMPGAKPDMSPEDVAGVVLYLAAEAPAALTGSCVDVFG